MTRGGGAGGGLCCRGAASIWRCPLWLLSLPLDFAAGREKTNAGAGCLKALPTLLELQVAGLPLAQVAQRCGALAVTGAVGGQVLPRAWGTGRGLVRGLRFWKVAMPIYMEYRRMQWSMGRDEEHSPEEKEELWQELHQKHAPDMLQVALNLRGFYVKIGQVASTRRDMFPQAWTDSLQKLQGEHPELLARPVKDVWRIVRRDLGERADDIAEMAPEALGAGATAQVHRGWLQDGSEVVVKVQYPEAHRRYKQDFANVKLFCALLQKEHLSYIRELERQFMTEFDFQREAYDLAEVWAATQEPDYPYAKQVVVPRPVPELASRNVVVMELLPGETLLKYGLRKKRELEKASFLWRIWRGFFLSRELRAHLDLLVHVQGHQIFAEGTFNGDPHPGNILLMPDGRLGLIDYGNVRRLTIAERGQLGQLILALAAEDRHRVAKVARKLGFRTQRDDADVIFRISRLAFDRDDPESMILPDGTVAPNVQVYFESLGEMDPLVNIPPSFVMAARNSFLIRGLGTHLGVRMYMARQWRELAESAIRRAELAGHSGLRGR